MFDIGFFELLVIATLGLVVIGPERLPSAVRTLALWVARVKRSFQSTKTEFERAIGADDIRRQLHNEEVLQQLEEAKASLQSVHKSAVEPNTITTSGDSDSSIAVGHSSQTVDADKTLPPDSLPSSDGESQKTDTKVPH